MTGERAVLAQRSARTEAKSATARRTSAAHTPVTTLPRRPGHAEEARAPPPWDFAEVPLFASERAAGPAPAARPAPLPGVLQAKLAVGPVDDPLEREADRVADRVMRMPDPAAVTSRSSTPMLRRKCACEGSGKPCAACSAEQDQVLKRKATGTVTPSEAPPIVHQVLASPGRPLDAATRAFMEPRFGYDFSRVRVHADLRAQESAKSVHARAYTVGNDIVLGAESSRTGTCASRDLMAHELAHVVQQARPASPLPEHGSPLLSANGPLLARKFKEPPAAHCGGAWKCAETPCETADVAGNGSAPTKWTLEVRIDTDVEAATDMSGAEDVGHTYVVFKDSSGAEYSYGFYPRPGFGADPFLKPEVSGCVVHADTNHKACVDWTETYNLTQAQYNEALKFAQLNCKAPPNYNVLNFNCTTFAVEVAKKAGQSPPSPRGRAGTGGLYTFEADNPNTLKDAYRDKDIPTWRLKSDGEIRDWISGHSSADIAALPVGEKIRLMNRLLEGYISDSDVDACVKICSAVTDADERKKLRDGVTSHEEGMNSDSQKKRVQGALNPP